MLFLTCAGCGPSLALRLRRLCRAQTTGNSKFKIQNSKPKIRNPKRSSSVVKSRIKIETHHDVFFWSIQKPKFQNPKCFLLLFNPRSMIRNPNPRFQTVPSAVQSKPQIVLPVVQSQIQNRRSKILHPGSAWRAARVLSRGAFSSPLC